MAFSSVGTNYGAPPIGEIFSISPETTERPKDVLEEIAETARAIDTEGHSRTEVLQEVGQLMVSSMVGIQLEVNPASREDILEAAGKSQKVQAFIKSMVDPLLSEKESWHMLRNGFLAEVAVSVFLERSGFKVLEPSQKDDMKGKIDRWAVDTAENKVYAIQIKASKDLIGAKLSKVDQNKASLGVMSGYISAVQTMIKYVSRRQEFANKDVEFLIIELGAGEINEDAAFNQGTGVLTTEADNDLNDQLYEKVWNE